ncbi:MAG TPA: HAMP domain-containing sensor histidine kinase [Oscillospiraceae bacterium]|nr:HAMP domain-containing sensor histidine kinase [Oscillospiraceae bacterium]HPK36451.1 HAMP domain-containing sensor histidine kinase [Oscillospiraceae bacterium]HPR76420.1 HAMP domain-containing sensor histidine kinase [Oscillospiraceae bacterium]
MLKSIRAKLYILFISIVSLLVLLTLLLNTILLPKYYQYQRESVLRECYVDIANAIYDRSTDMKLKLGAIESKSGVRIFISDKYYRIIYGNDNTYMFQSASEVISRKEAFSEDTTSDGIDTQYTIIEMRYDNNTDLKYLTLSGFLEYQDDYYCIWIDTTVEAINDSVRISNTFLIYSTLFTMVMAGVAFYFLSTRFVKPIQEINTVAKKITVLDFSDKLDVGSKDEVGQLADSVNHLSSQLEATITDLQRANMQLKLDLLNRDKTDKMRKEFISNVSHELKTPLALILGYSEGLKVGINEDDRDFYCDVIQDEANNMSKLVSRLLYVSQLESEAMKPDMSRFEINALINTVLETLKIQFDEKHIKPVSNYEFEGEIYADIDQIRQVVTNYLTNAIHHCGGEMKVTIKTERTDAGRLKVTVFNTGEHIPEESLPHVWESFYKVDKARTREYGGTGLGLYIVSQIISNHNGTYGVENVENGVQFWFELEV